MPCDARRAMHDARCTTQVLELDKLIYKHHKLFLEADGYGERLFKPKNHFASHFPTDILNFGPVRGYWCMRFEALNQLVSPLPLEPGAYGPHIQIDPGLRPGDGSSKTLQNLARFETHASGVPIFGRCAWLVRAILSLTQIGAACASFAEPPQRCTMPMSRLAMLSLPSFLPLQQRVRLLCSGFGLCIMQGMNTSMASRGSPPFWTGRPFWHSFQSMGCSDAKAECIGFCTSTLMELTPPMACRKQRCDPISSQK